MSFVDATAIRDLLGANVLSVEATADLDSLLVSSVDLPEQAQRSSVSWLRRGGRLRDWYGCVLLAAKDRTLPESLKTPHAVFTCRDPKQCIAEVIRAFFSETKRDILVAPQSRIHPSATVGADGQGYDWIDGRWVAFPQIGGIIICENVTIGPSTTIMRAAIGDTVISNGTKIGNGVNIGHGVHIGEHCLIAAHATIGGSARIGKRVKIWQSASVKHSVSIGDDAEIGMGAVVVRDVPARQCWAGNPARRIR